MSLKEDLFEKLNLFMDKHNDFDNEHLYHQILCIMEEYKERKYDEYQAILDHFSNEHMFYYIPSSELYVEYKNSSFKIVNENDLIHKILSFLSEHRVQYNLNTQVKNTLQMRIQKCIKQKNIYDNIPDSETLQTIISFFQPNLFNEKDNVKYFLIIIGDILLKKNKCIFFVPVFIKSFLQNLNKYITLYFHNIQIMNYFKFKYSDHEQSISRVIPMNPLNMNYFELKEDFFVNMICVCFHYSIRYHSSEDYLDSMNKENEWIENVLWVKNNTKETMVECFVSEYIVNKDQSYIDEKDMLFLWKSYLTHHNKLNVFQKKQDLYDAVGKYISYDKHYYWNVSSMYLPYVEDFKDFWTKCIYEDENEYEFEINELHSIYHEKYKSKINESIFIDLIEYYYPNLEIKEEKYICNIGCTLWNKKKELEPYFEKNKDVHELYQHYCRDFKSNRKVSKQYFIHYYRDYFT